MVYDNFTVGQAIRKLRKGRHMSIGELADAVDRSPAHLNMVELGSRNISFGLLYALMTVFDTDANSVLGITIQKEGNKEKSVDQKLQELEPKQRKYFMEMFFHMLDHIPA